MEKDKIIQIVYWKNPKEGYMDLIYALTENGNIYESAVPEEENDYIKWRLVLESPELKEK